MKFRTAVLSSLLAGCLTGSVAHAADLLVPKQFATIQSAIDAAANGDSVLVSPGTYHEQVNLSGKGIALIGVGGAAVTAIDGDNTRTVILGNGEPDTCLVQGFTIQNGFTVSNGGGVYIQNSSARFTDCVFLNNRASASALWGAAAWRSVRGSPAITRCRFDGSQSAYTTADIYHYLGGSITISDCLFTNSASRFGSAIHIQNEGGSIAMSISNCAFRNISNTPQNNSDDVHAPVFFWSPGGGTITGSITNCTFECPLASPDLPTNRVAPLFFGGCGFSVELVSNRAQGVADWFAAEYCGATVPIMDGGGNILTPACCPSDLDGNGIVNAVDLSYLLAQWGDCIGCRADTTADDGIVEGKDLATLLSAWGVCQ